MNMHSNSTIGDEQYMIPSAMEQRAWQLWLCSVLYLSIGVVATFGLIQARRKAFFRAAFLAASALLCFLRGCLMLVHVSGWSTHMFWLYLCNLLLPVYLQYWMFSLLILFVWRCHLIIHDQEDLLHKYLYPSYAVVQVALLALCIVAAYLLSHTFKPDGPAHWDRNAALYVAFLYAVLVVFGVYFAHRSTTMIAIGGHQLTWTRSSKLRQVGALIVLFLLLLALRAVWNTLYWFDANPLQRRISEFIHHHDTSAFYWSFLAFYMIFEIIPTAVVVYIFAIKVVTPPGGDDTAQYKRERASPLGTPVDGGVSDGKGGIDHSTTPFYSPGHWAAMPGGSLPGSVFTGSSGISSKSEEYTPARGDTVRSHPGVAAGVGMSPRSPPLDAVYPPQWTSAVSSQQDTGHISSVREDQRHVRAEDPLLPRVLYPEHHVYYSTYDDPNMGSPVAVAPGGVSYSSPDHGSGSYQRLS